MGSKEQISKIESSNPVIQIEGSAIEKVHEIRNLGVVFDGKLQFETHISEAVRNCFYRLKLLYRIRPYINVNVRIMLCESLILSKLNYADTVYGSCLLSRTGRLIQRVQNSCARFCFPVPPRSHVTPYINKGNLLKMEARRKLHLATLMFGVVLTRKPIYLFEKISWSRDYNQHKTRASLYLMSTQTHRTAAFRGSFKYAASRCWNDLPPPLRACKTISTFSKNYKTFLTTLQKQKI